MKRKQDIRQAIRTKYFGPTNTKGSKIQATCAAKTIYVGYDHGLNVDDNHIAAAEKLAKALGWDKLGTYQAGCFRNEYYFVQVPKKVRK